jgi:hypothetical protein
MQANATMAGDYTVTWPAAVAGNNSSVLTSTTGGTLAWSLINSTNFFTSASNATTSASGTVSYYEEYTHTTNINEMSGTPSMTIKLVRVGKVVTFNVTSGVNVASKTNSSPPSAATAFPAAWRPSADVYIPYMVRDNNTWQLGWLELGADGSLTWLLANHGAWTSAGVATLSESGGGYTVL